MKFNDRANVESSEFFQNVNERNSEILQLVSSIVFGVMFFAWGEVYWVSCVGFAIVAYVTIWYIESLGRGSAILQIMLIIASYQWLLGPIIAYHFDGETLRYRMYVSEEEYMNFVVPAVMALLIGVRMLPTRISLLSISYYIQQGGLAERYIYLLIITGLLVDVFVAYVPSSLLFVAYIVSQFKYIGLLYLIVSEHRYRWLFSVTIFLISLTASAEAGLFHGMILWSALIFSYVCITLSLTRSRKLLVMFLGVVLLTSLQTIKADYRNLIATEKYQDENKVTLLFGMLLGSVQYVDADLDSDEFEVGNLNARMNQGWIISSVMGNVKDGDFVEGETIISALKDSFLPRFLVDKRAVRVSDNFERFTGLTLNKNTSMGISILGEAYVNFATLGGVVFMFLWGLFIAVVMKIIVWISINHPTIILWAPLIFLQMVKAETELVVVLNHGIKTSIVIAIFYLTAKKILGWRI